jgi:hypothetical protein
LEVEMANIVSAKEHQERIRESERALELLRAEQDRVADAIESCEQQYEARKAAAKAGILEAGLTRKTMTPKQKSEVIQALGSEGYLALPWD